MSESHVTDNPPSTPGTTSGASVATNANTSNAVCGQVATPSNHAGMMASGLPSVTSGINTSIVNTQPIAHTITVGQNSALQVMPPHHQQSHTQQHHSAQLSAAGMAAAMAAVPQNGAAIPPMNMAVAAQMAAAGAPHNHLGQPMQMISQPLGSPYLPQFSYNQQLMLQNAAAVQVAMQAQAMSGSFPMATMAGAPRPTHVGPKSPGVQGPTVLSPGASQAGHALAVSVGASCTNNQQAMGTMVYAGATHKQAFVAGKMGDSTPGTPTGPHPQVITGKATMLQRAPPGTAQAQPIVIGQIGVVSGQPSNAGLMAQQCGPDGKPVTTLAQSSAQLLSSHQAQALRLTGQQQLVTNSGQILTSQPMFTNQAVLQAMASLQQSMPLTHQPFVAAQSHGILPGQPLYIRAASQLQPQAMMTANMEPIGVVKGQRIIDSSAMANMQNKPATTTITTSPKPAAQIQGRSFSTILPSTSKPPTSTAKVRPTQMTNQTVQGPKLNIPQVTSKQATMKARGRGIHKPGITSGVVSKTPGIVAARALSHPKPGTPSAVTTTTTGASSSNNLGSGATKSQSDSEVETSKKSITSSTSQIQGISSGSSMLHKPAAKIVAVTATAKVEPTIKHEVIKKTSHKLVIDTSLPQLPMVATMNGIDSGDTDRSEESSLDSTVVTEHKKPEAVVKPHILTHYIEGFIIQEGPEPFPVQRSSLLTEFIPPKLSQEPMLMIETEDGLFDNEEDMLNHDEFSFDTSDDQPPQLSPHAGLDTDVVRVCEYCGKAAMAKKFRRSRRFCSMVCAKRYNVSCSKKRLGLMQSSGAGISPLMYKKKHSMLKMKKSWRGARGGGVAGLSPGGHGLAVHPPELDLEYQSSSPTEMEDTSSSANSPAVLDVDTDMMDMPRAPLAIWTVQDVYDFIQSIAGCGVYAEEFRSQEIDGQALLLLKEDHLMTAMNIKLGPALKICARINALKGGNLG